MINGLHYFSFCPTFDFVYRYMYKYKIYAQKYIIVS